LAVFFFYGYSPNVYPDSLAALEQQRSRILTQILGLGDIRSGSITTISGRCGKPNCRCHQPNQPGRGPNFAPDKKLIAVDFDPQKGIAGAPRVLFQTRVIGVRTIGFQYDVAPDGRFLVNSLPSRSSPLTLLTGWPALLKH
jgi:hypothetical protein